MKMEREQIKKMLTYGTLQSIVENTIMKMSSLYDADMAEVRTHIFNRLMNQAKNLKNQTVVH